MEGLYEFLHPPPSAAAALAALSPSVRAWFVRSFGAPTPAQRFAWPIVTAGRNLLLAAPTGSGKTLAACLPILGTLQEESTLAGVQCLYVAPLKALLGDVRFGLRRALRAMRLEAASTRFVRVGLRTGDTGARRRRQLRERPPDFLLTTPESLALLLSQPAATEYFTGVRWVIVDEIHALVGSKRGADLALSLERLGTLTATEPQRIGLSATCAPLEEAAHFLAGAERPCAIAEIRERTPLELTVEPLVFSGASEFSGGGFLARLVARLEPELLAYRTTLLFTNTRRLAERVAWSLRRRFPAWAPQIAVHHSSLAAERRRAIERSLKRGELRAVVSSTSLELGIDIGSVDQVVLIHPPGGVVRLLQRVGRSGHGPGRARRGLVLTASAAELCEAAVTCAAGHAGQAEPTAPLVAPLDVLCQQLLGMACVRDWAPDEAFALVRRAGPFRDLNRADFNGCLDYLSGRRRDGTAWLPERLRWAAGRFTLLDRRTMRLLWRNLGTILSEEPRPVVQEIDDKNDLTTHDLIGHVDEAYADRLQPGDRFVLDGRCLEVRQQTRGQVVVHEVLGKPTFPQWAGGEWPVTPKLAERLYLLRVRAAEALREGPAALHRLLAVEYQLPAAAVRELADYFLEQERRSEIPDQATCLVEQVSVLGGGEYYVHTPLHRAGNDALVRVVVHRLARDYDRATASLAANLGFALFVRDPTPLTAAVLHAVLAADRFEADLREAIQDSVSLRERFHRAAQIGFMVLQNPPGGPQRVGGTDWTERRLFDQARSGDPDFILLRQATRELLHECCDLPAALAYLDSLPRRSLRWRRLTHVSPFAASWSQALAGPAVNLDPPTDALERLHQQITGGTAVVHGA